MAVQCFVRFLFQCPSHVEAQSARAKILLTRANFSCAHMFCSTCLQSTVEKNLEQEIDGSPSIDAPDVDVHDQEGIKTKKGKSIKSQNLRRICELKKSRSCHLTE
jgi:hypothetical protein